MERIIIALVVGIALFFGGYYVGHGNGVNEQKVADQVEFDRINGDLAQQKAEAADRYRSLVADNLNLINARDRAKFEQERQREQDRQATEQLRTRLAGLGLRFNAGQGAGHWGSGRGADGARSGAASDAGAAIVELPGALAADLRQFAYACDTLRNDYALLYRWAYSDAVKCSRPK